LKESQNIIAANNLADTLSDSQNEENLEEQFYSLFDIKELEMANKKLIEVTKSKQFNEEEAEDSDS